MEERNNGGASPTLPTYVPLFIGLVLLALAIEVTALPPASNRKQSHAEFFLDV